jgi:hypothetical protein
MVSVSWPAEMDWPDGSVSPGSRRSLLVAEHGGDRAERHARAHRPGGNFVTVMTGPPVPTSGVYYLSASLTLEIGAGDVAGCAFAPGVTGAPWTPVPFERIERVPRVFDYMF